MSVGQGRFGFTPARPVAEEGRRQAARRRAVRTGSKEGGASA